MSSKPANARERILLAAKTLLSAQGIRATGVDSIVKSANTHKMTLYQHFASKEALVVAYLQNRAAEFWAQLLDQRDGAAPTSQALLLGIFDVLGEWMAAPDFQGCPLIMASAEFPDQSDPAHQVSVAFYRKLQHHMSELSARAGARSPERLAGQLCALFQGAMVSAQLQRHFGAAIEAKLAAEILIKNSIE